MSNLEVNAKNHHFSKKKKTRRNCRKIKLMNKKIRCKKKTNLLEWLKFT